MKEIFCAINMIRLVVYNPGIFQNDQAAAVLSFMISLMKFLGGFLTELFNIFLIIESEQITDVVKDFIALGIIAEIDNIMVLSVGAANIDHEV